MKKILILFIYLFSFFNLFSQVNPVGAGRIPNATTNFTTSIPYGFNLIDANTNKSYRVIRANGLDYNKKLSDYALGTDYLGSLTSLSVICNNGITKTLTDSISTPVLTLGLGSITPTSVSASGAITANNLWYLNGNTLGAKNTLGSTDNQDFGIITNNTERLTVLKSGNVGIGTISPISKFNISKGTSLTTWDGNMGGGVYDLFVGSYDGLNITTTSNREFRFQQQLLEGSISTILIHNGRSTGTTTASLQYIQGNYNRFSAIRFDQNGNIIFMTNPGNVGSGTNSNITPINSLFINYYGGISIYGGLHVGGTSDAGANNILANGTVTGTRLISNIVTGTSPLSVTSTTKVDNLNSDLLDGYEASHFGTGNGSVTSIATTSPLTGGTITTTGTIAINSDTLTNWYSKQNKGKLAYDSLNYRYRRGDTATYLLSQNRASHQYLGKYANAVSATSVYTIPDIGNDVDYYMPFLINTDESNSLNTNSYFIYNPHLNLLSTNLLGNVTGNVSGSSGSCIGNAATATSANKVEIDTIATDLDARIPFMAATGGNQKLYMDNTIKYNSGTETLTVTNLAGNATSSNKTDSIFVDYNNDDGEYPIPFASTTNAEYVKLHQNGGITYNPYLNILYGYFEGDLTGNATTSTTSGTADVALALDDPSLYSLTDFNSYGASAYSIPIANGSGGITWGTTSGGINAKNYATVVATSNITQSGTGQTIDGQVCNAGATVICVGQSIKASNGAWLIPESGAWTRRIDMDTWAELYQAYIPIVSGTTYGGSSWYCTIPNSGTLGVTDITFTEFLFPSSIEAGAGLTKTGTTLSTNVDNSTIEIHIDTLRIKDLGITTAKLANSSVTNAKIPAAAGIDVTKLQGVSGTTGAGNMVLSGHPAFSSSTGVSPFTVSSTTKVSNLNTDQVDGADLETTITNSDAKIPSSKAVIRYVTGEVRKPFQVVDVNYTITSGEFTLLVENTASDVTISLPAVNDNVGRIIFIKKSSNNSYKVRISATGGQQIENSSYVDLLSQNKCVMLQAGSYNSNIWIMLSKDL